MGGVTPSSPTTHLHTPALPQHPCPHSWRRCFPRSTLHTPHALQVRHLQQALVYTKGDKDVAAIKHVLATLTGEEGFEDEPVF